VNSKNNSNKKYREQERSFDGGRHKAQTCARDDGHCKEKSRSKSKRTHRSLRSAEGEESLRKRAGDGNTEVAEVKALRNKGKTQSPHAKAATGAPYKLE
jgi:hypothetical protein